MVREMGHNWRKERVITYFEQMGPDHAQKKRMREKLQTREQMHGRWRFIVGRKLWIPVSLASMMMLMIILNMNFGGHQTAFAVYLIPSEDVQFQLQDTRNMEEEYGTYANYVDSRPSLRFFIDGKNIAKIEMMAENEFVSAKDWTETQDEKYWNIEYYQYFDEEKQMSIADFSKIYDKKLEMNFDQDFQAYGDIWYEWRARNLYEWAAENNFSRFIGYGVNLDNLSEKEKLSFAAGDDGSPLGHIWLEGYPEDLLKDTITIRVTDHQGNVIEKTIHVQVSNNEIGQTVVTAWLGD